MIYKDFQGLKLSQLGFGTMRLPLREDKSIDAEQAAAMTSEAIAKGVNYFDTAWPYHSGKSELVIGEILKQYPRESFYLADKFPGHQIAPSYDVKGVFEKQLKKCGVEYFDFYCCTTSMKIPSPSTKTSAGTSSRICWSRRKTGVSATWASRPTRACPRWKRFWKSTRTRWNSVRSS